MFEKKKKENDKYRRKSLWPYWVTIDVIPRSQFESLKTKVSVKKRLCAVPAR